MGNVKKRLQNVRICAYVQHIGHVQENVLERLKTSLFQT